MMVINRDGLGNLHIRQAGAARKVFRPNGWTRNADSTFYYRVLQTLRATGETELIRAVPEKHGHLTSNPYYLVNRKRTYAYFYDHHQITSPAEEYNAGRTVVLRRVELT